MSFSYAYTLGTDFTATNIDVSAFQTTVAATSGLSSIQYITRSGPSVTLYFSSSIIGGNLTTLNGLVSSYVYGGSADITTVDVSSFQTITNKQLATSNFISDEVDTTKKLGFALVGMTTATQLTLASSLTASRTYTIPDGGAASSFLLTNSTGTQTVASGNLAFSGASSVLTIANTAASTGTSTGALRVAGGAFFGNFYTKLGTISSPGAVSTLYIDCQGSTTNIGQLVFKNSSNTGDFAIYGDGGDLYWQGGGGRALQMAAFHGIILLGGRNTTVQPTYVAGTNSTFNVSIQNINDSIGLIVQGVSGQTADLQQWQNSSATILSRVVADGSIVITASAASTSSTTGGLRVTGGAYFGGASIYNALTTFNAVVIASSASNQITIPTYRVVSSTTTSTTSTSLVAITGITLTPTVAGTYLIHFEAQIFANAASRTGTFAIAFNGTAITGSTTSVFLPTATTGFLQVVVTAFQTCNGTTDVLTAIHQTSASTLSETYKVFYAQRIST